MRKLFCFKELKIALVLVLFIAIYGIININGSIDNIYQKVIGQEKKSVLLYTKNIGDLVAESTEYDLNKEYIYGGTKDVSSVITSLNDFNSSNDIIFKLSNDNKIKVYRKSNNLSLGVSWYYISISSDKYSSYLDNAYIFNNNQNIESTDFTISGTDKCRFQEETNSDGSKKYTLYYENDEIRHWDIIEYKSEKGEIIYSNNPRNSYTYIISEKPAPLFTSQELKVYNGKYSYDRDDSGHYPIYIKYNDSEEPVITIYPIVYKIEDYNYDSKYIYVNDKEIDESKVTQAESGLQGEMTYNETDNIVTLYSNYGYKTGLKEWKIIQYQSEKYNQYMDQDYIFTTEDFNVNDVLLSNENGETIRKIYDEKNHTLKIEVEGNIVKEWQIITLKSDYDISFSSEYIFTGFKKFDINNISYSDNIKMEEDNKQLLIKYKNETIKELNIESLSTTSYQIIDNFIVADKSGTIDSNKITASGNFRVQIFSVAQNAPRSIWVMTNSEKVKEYGIVEWSSSTYDLSKDYIYVGSMDINNTDIQTEIKNKITVGQTSDTIYKVIEENELRLKSPSGKVLKKWDIVSYQSEEYSTFLDNYDFINTYTNTLDLDKITVTNADKEMINNQFVIRYKNDIIKAWDIECWQIDNTKQVANYLIVGDDFDESNVHTINCRYSINNNFLTIVFSPFGESHTINGTGYNIIKASEVSSKYDLTKDYIYVENGSLNLDDITVPSSITKEINDNKLQMKTSSGSLLEWDIVQYTSQNSTLKNTNYIHVHNITSNTLEFYKNNYLEVTGNASVECTDDYKLKIMYGNEELQSWDIVGIEAEDYFLKSTITYLNIGTKELKEENIIKHNCKIEITDDGLSIIYGDKKIYTYKFIDYKSEKYDLTKDYIYVGTGNLDESSITTKNCNIQQTATALKIVYNSEVLREFEIASYNILNTDVKEDEDYFVYGLKKDDYDNRLDTFLTTSDNITKRIQNDRLELVYKDTEDVLKYWYLVSWNSNAYDLSKDYIYTLSDIETQLITVTNGEAVINGDTLRIRYNKDSEVMFAILKLSSNFFIENNIIYTNKNKITVSELLEGLKTNSSLTVKVYRNNTEITAGDVNTGDTVKILSTLYGEMAEYGIDNSNVYLDLSKLSTNEDLKVIYSIEKDTSFNDLKEKIDTSGNILLKDNVGVSVSENRNLKTGDIISIDLGENTVEYRVAVTGDVTGDGTVDIGDVSKLYSYIRGSRLITEPCELLAADITNEGEVDIGDVAKLYAIIRSRG